MIFWLLPEFGAFDGEDVSWFHKLEEFNTGWLPLPLLLAETKESQNSKGRINWEISLGATLASLPSGLVPNSYCVKYLILKLHYIKIYEMSEKRNEIQFHCTRVK